MGTKKFVVLTAVVGMLSAPAVALACGSEYYGATCDPKTEATFELKGQCWQAKCEGKVDTPLSFIVSARTCFSSSDSLELYGNATITSCTTLQLAEDLADINSIKTECNGVDGVQKLQIKATDQSLLGDNCETHDDCCSDYCNPSGFCDE